MSIHKITETSQPVFPCWLWMPHAQGWAGCPTARTWNHHLWSATHWHPDSETAPSFAPEEEGVPCIDRLSAGFHAAVERDRLAGTSSPDWVMEAAKKLFVVTNIPEHERENLIAVNANIIRQHAPKHAPSVPAVEGVREAVHKVSVKYWNMLVTAFPSIVRPSLADLQVAQVELTDNMLKALMPYLAPAQGEDVLLSMLRVALKETLDVYEERIRNDAFVSKNDKRMIAEHRALLLLAIAPAHGTDKCFWESGCSDRPRCAKFGGCVADAQNKAARLQRELAPHPTVKQADENWHHTIEGAIAHIKRLEWLRAHDNGPKPSVVTETVLTDLRKILAALRSSNQQ